MESKKYIEMLKSEKHDANAVAMRQTLCHFLYNNGIPCTIISRIFGCSRWNVYLSIYRTRDLLEIGDALTREAHDEISRHQIRVKPYTIDGEIMSRHMGYRMIIDNIIY